MRILHVIPGLTRERGGPSTVVCALAKHQSNAGHQVTILTTNQGHRNGEQMMDIPQPVSFHQLQVLGPDRLAYTPTFTRIVRRLIHAADIVHVHSIFTQPVHAALREARAARKPLVLRPCGQLHPYSLRRTAWAKRTYLRICGSMVRQACTAWHYTSEQECNESWPWDESPRFIVPNGVEPDEFDLPRSEARRHVSTRWPELGESPYVLYLGRLHRKKRLDILLDSFLSSSTPPWKLVVAGPDESNLWPDLVVRYLNKPGTANRVHRTGTVSGKDKSALLCAANLFALPSEHENFGIGAIEALAAGVPVLLSPNVDICQAAIKVGIGHVAPLRTDAWRAQLSKCVRTDHYRDDLAERSRRWVRANYGWESVTRTLTERYQLVLAGLPLDSATALAS